MTETITHWMRPPHGGAFPISDSGEPAGASRTPLVMVPGIGGPRGMFYHQVDAFRAERRVVTLNLSPVRGAGRTSIESSAHDLAAVLDDLGIATADLLGASFGTTIVTRFTLDRPERVRRLVWVAPPVVRHAPWRRTFGAGWLVGGALLAYSPARYHRHVAHFLARQRLYSPEPELHPDELELMARRVTDTQVMAFFERLVALGRWDWSALPAPFPRPLLIVQGKGEERLTPPDVRAAWQRLCGGKVAAVRGHHMPYLSFPDEFNSLLKHFLDAPDEDLPPRAR